MHPILARLERLGGYLALWCVAGVFESAVLTQQGGLTWPEALVQVLPPLLVYSFVCLSAWYVCRATPLATSNVSRVLTASIVAAFVAAAVWLALSEAWLATLESMPELSPVTSRFRTQIPFLFAVNVMLYLLVLSVHYVVLSFEAFRTAERQQLELQVLTRDAELRALRAQIDPHFLYNCLNSISALTGSDAPAARRMCLLLAEFLRTTLRVSMQQRITMAEELSLAERFLSIEQVRFGERLQVERSVDESALECQVPPLVLQPLLENAVGHGIASMVDGGTIRLGVVRRGDRLSITIENPRDPDAVPRKRGGVGLENVRKRLAIVFGGAARMDAAASPTGFRVAIDLPSAVDA